MAEELVRERVLRADVAVGAVETRRWPCAEEEDEADADEDEDEDEAEEDDGLRRWVHTQP